MKAENWTPSDAVNYYVGMNKPETTQSKADVVKEVNK